MTGHHRHRVNDPAWRVNLGAPRPSATMGDILAWRRKRAGLSVVQVATWDGTWTPQQVAELETCRTISKTEIARYLRALGRQRPS